MRIGSSVDLNFSYPDAPKTADRGTRRMLNIDAYDQPAVETGKKATFGLMGREGYGEWLTKVNEALGQTDHTI